MADKKKKVVGIFVKVQGTSPEELGTGIRTLKEKVAAAARQLGHRHIKPSDVWIGKRRPRTVSRMLDFRLNADKLPILQA